MTKLEERIRSGLLDAAERIPDASPDSRPAVVTGRPRKWVAVAAVAAALLLFAPLLFLGGSGEGDVGSGGNAPGSADTTLSPGSVSSLDPEGEIPPEGGPAVSIDTTTTILSGINTSPGPNVQFSAPQHIRLRFVQELDLECAGLDLVDNGGFDEYEADIWIDGQGGYTRVNFVYPDGSGYDLMLKGRPGDWEQAWGRGRDLGRNAGCREDTGGGGSTQTIAGWGFHDSSMLWVAAYLRPVSQADGGVWIDHEFARPSEDGTYVIESRSGSGTEIRFEFVLDESGERVLNETRFVDVADEFEARATIEVLESGPAMLPDGIFDTAGFAPLWDTDTVVTTLAP